MVNLPQNSKGVLDSKEGDSMMEYIFDVVYLLILYRIVKEIK